MGARTALGVNRDTRRADRSTTAHRLLLLVLVASLAVPALAVALFRGIGYEPPTLHAQHSPSEQVAILRAQVEELERRALEAEAAACPSLGTSPVVYRRPAP